MYHIQVIIPNLLILFIVRRVFILVNFYSKNCLSNQHAEIYPSPVSTIAATCVDRNIVNEPFHVFIQKIADGNFIGLLV